MTYKQKAFAAVVIIALGLVLTSWTRVSTESHQITKPVDPIPTPSQIESLTVVVPTLGIQDLKVSSEHWKRIRDAMLPAEVDKNPAPWEELGRLTILTTSGKTMVMDLYYVEDTGAFSVDGAYYRGGDSERLRLAIQAAFDAGLQERHVAP